jgi:hypothetical protein
LFLTLNEKGIIAGVVFPFATGKIKLGNYRVFSAYLFMSGTIVPIGIGIC